MVDVRCLHCGEPYHVEESHHGKETTCVRCGMITRLERRVIITPPPPSMPVTHYEPAPPKQPAVTVRKKHSVGRWLRRTVTFDVDRRTTMLAGILLGLLIMMGIYSWLGPSDDSPASQQPLATKPATPPPSPRSGRQSAPLPIKVESPTPSGRTAARIRDRGSPPVHARLVLPPCAVGWPIERPLTGDSLESGQVDGSPSDRRLTVFNGQSEDAAVRFADAATGLTFRFVYIRAGDSYTIHDVDPGSYSLLFETGREWVPHCKGFIRDEHIQETDEPMDFDPYTYGSITLYRVPNGNAKAHPIDRKRFFQGDQNVEIGQ